MTRWAWVIDQTRCIGCHACTTACKAENDVALGVFRTWVKSVDVGVFPRVRRHFAVLRCNHCEDAPCVEICPVTAMYQRPDGLVDFDEELCIGCKACMQACPYDAIYMDPETDTAAKCNFCSHRVDTGLLPACVVVCPVEALLFGDMDDPTSKVSRALAAHSVTVRRTEQRTRPKAFYIGAHEAALDPLAADHEGMYAWADRQADAPTHRRTDAPWDGQPPRRSVAGGAPRSRSVGASVRRSVVAYDIPRQRAWGWRVSSYIWTKSLAAGLALVPALMHRSGHWIGGPFLGRLAPLLALAFLALTGALLVGDLKRPERFWTILVRPQWRSWLARGAFIITAYGVVLAAWTAAAWRDHGQWLTRLTLPTIALALLTAAYTAFLFNQCEGRDLWQSPLLVFHLLLHAPLAGIAALCVTAPLLHATDRLGQLLPWAALGFAAMGALMLMDAYGRHPTPNAAAAAHALTRGRYATLFRASLALGVLVPAVVFALELEPLLQVAAALALAGLWMYGHSLVLAGQGPPIS